MTRALSSLLTCLACCCGVLLFSSCGESDDTPDTGTGMNSNRPPAQQSIYLRRESKEKRKAGTEIFSTKTLTMSDARLTRHSGDESVVGSADMILRDAWTVDIISDNERTFRIDEMSFSQKSEAGGKPRQQSLNSDLVGAKSFIVKRDNPESGWELAEQELSGLHERELKAIGEVWSEHSHALYPEESLEIGQEWTADPKALGYIISPRLQIDNGEVNCRLHDITVHRGERCAEISIDIDVSGVLKTHGTRTNVQIALAGTITRSLQTFFDMRTELEGTMQWEMDFPVEKSSVSIDGIAKYIGISEMSTGNKESDEPEVIQ